VTRICIIQGHPSGGDKHFCHALARSYVQGAVGAGHETRTVCVAELDFPVLRSKQDWDIGQTPPAIADAQAAIRWAEHLLILHPLWIGSMPALLKAFFEQTLRPGFALTTSANGNWTKLLSGRSARVVVTMGMPAIAYRFWFGAHGLKSLTQNLALVGIRPTRSTLIGMIEGINEPKRSRWLERMRALGKCAG
jgi:putative NADPH-quinone reductase